MPLIYYSVAAEREFWSEHWSGQSPDGLLRLARSSALTALIIGALPTGARVLEAGCGLGQYVRLLRELGWRATGIDWSLEALRGARLAAPGTPFAVGDLRELGVRGQVIDAYLSLGVVEHDPAGPDAILREARRVLRRDGVLLLSVPYINGVRRLGAWWIRRRNQRLREAGAQFYQFAFGRREAVALVERNGFRVLRTMPYDPARMLRTRLRAVLGLSRARVRRASGPTGAEPRGVSGRWRPTLRRLLYTRPVLAALGHMILLIAVKR